MTLEACMRCATLAPLSPLSYLKLCSGCMRQGVRPMCEDFHHAYVGGQHGWVCLTCGYRLTHTPINTAVVEVPKPAQPDVYC
jgi:hypothetical protein